MPSIAIVDAGPLVAAVNPRDSDHGRVVSVLLRPDLQLVIPTLVIAEVAYLVARDVSTEAEAGFLRGLARFEVQAPRPEDWERIADLVEQYADFPLGGTDAS